MQTAHDGGPGRLDGLVVRRLEPSEWRLLSGLRRDALRDAPLAFSSDGHEPEWSFLDWKRTFGTGVWVVAELGNETIGLARLTRPDDEPAHIESVWTRRGHRRIGVASALVSHLIDLAVEHGDTEILVWVIEPNPVARLLYESLRFEPTGERQPWGVSGERLEERLRLPVADARP